MSTEQSTISAKQTCWQMMGRCDPATGTVAPLSNRLGMSKGFCMALKVHKATIQLLVVMSSSSQETQLVVQFSSVQAWS